MIKFFRFEVRYWLKRPMVYIFLAIFALLVFGAMTSDNVQIGSGKGITHANAPLVIQTYFGVLSLIGLIMMTSFFNATATRDYSYGMDQIIFASPIKKKDFFFGKFFGAFFISTLPYIGITLAAWISPYMPWVDAQHFGPFSWPANLYGFLLFAVCNTFFSGAIIYAFAIYFRNPIISYLAAFGIIILYVIATVMTKDVENQHLAVLLDPIGSRAADIYTAYWTPAQRNTDYISFATGLFLVNRLLWAAVGLVILFIVYRLFDFTQSRHTARKRQRAAGDMEELPMTEHIPKVIPAHRPVAAWSHQFAFELRSIVRNNAFIILTAIGLLNLITDFIFNTGNFGQRSLPVTYSVIELIDGDMLLFIMAFIVFYSGYIVFREKDVRMDEIVDTTPVKNGMIVTTKLAAVLASIVIILALSTVMGMIFQLFSGFTRFQTGLYIRYFAMDLLTYFFTLVMAYLLQLLINNKYIGYVAIVAFLACNLFLWQALRVESNLVRFGKLPTVTYSDMNGFGPFVPGIAAFGLYWTLFCSLLILLIIGMSLRGKENGINQKVARMGVYLRSHPVLSTALLVLFLAFGGWMYYNIRILNSYISARDKEDRQATYEQKYKRDESLPLPFTTAVDFTIDLFPAKRSMHTQTRWWVKNIHSTPITTLPFNMPEKATNATLDIPGAILTSEDAPLRYNVYKLQKPLQPGDSLLVSYTADFVNRGVENEVSFTQLTSNGSFFNAGDILPVIGYASSNELTNTIDRRKHALARRQRLARLTRNCTDTCNTTYINNSANWVDCNTTISTSDGQIAVAPGTLIRQWKKDGRSYFNYRLQHKALDFFSFIAADYEVIRDSVNHIAIEIYFDKHHPYNVDRMVAAIKKSLSYYTANFGPYYQRECRIIEFPRYAGFAQAFPGTMPYSEAIGFINDLRDTSMIDLVTYVVSHEMGHQWWAHQVIGPAMQGSESFSEGLAQYSALMVMKKEYGPQKMSRFLKYELDSYLRGRAQEKEYENPLMRTENQGYIHYSKASLVYYYMQEMLGEQKFNAILKKVVSKYAYTEPPFPTAYNIVDELRAGTPDSLSYLITDLFENITLFDNRTTRVTATETSDHRYRVEMRLQCGKFRSDSLGNEKKVPMNDYIDVALFDKNTNDPGELGPCIATERLRITGDTTVFFTVAHRPYQAGVDPYHYLIDKIIADNLKKLD